MEESNDWDEILPPGTFLTEEGAIKLAKSGTKLVIKCAESARLRPGGSVTGLWFVEVWYSEDGEHGVWLKVSKAKRDSVKGYKTGYGILSLCLRFGLPKAFIPLQKGTTTEPLIIEPR